MNCPYCQAPADPTNPFCRNCGKPVNAPPMQQYYNSPYAYQQAPPEKDKSSLYLMIYLGWGIIHSVLWQLIYRFILRDYIRDHGIDEYTRINIIISVVFTIISMALLIVFIILIKRRDVRTFLIIYTIAFLLLQLFYMIQ